MDPFDFNLSDFINCNANRSRPQQKRRWREIETIKERKRLLKELQSIDASIDENILEEFQF